jgi:mannosyl-3-phosphoglycerate phosphatase
VIITDLDGTLLDQKTYSYQACLPAIRKVQSSKIPLVLCSSKTRSEIEPLWKELKLEDPFIVENGGAIYFRPGYFPFTVENARDEGGLEKLALGQSVKFLRHVLLDAVRRFRVHARSFGDMRPDEIAQLTGLPRESAWAASQREYDEPFVVDGGNAQRLFTALRTKGLKIARGDRFFHLSCGSDKGRATNELLKLYRRSNPSLVSVGIGNSANDLPLLCHVDRPVLVRNPDGSWDSTVAQNLSAARHTLNIGPEGWREAVEEILEQFRV